MKDRPAPFHGLRTAKGISRCMLLAAAVLLCAGTVHAAEEQAPTKVYAPAPAPSTTPDQIMLRLGGYHVRGSNNLLRLDADGAPVGAYIDFAETLGGDTTATVMRLDGLYRFNEQHAVSVAWYALRFDGTKTLGRLISWGTITIDATTPVNSKLEYDVYKVNYQYSLFHSDKVELAAQVGFHMLQAYFSIDAAGYGGSKNTSITAPMPVIGLFADYHFTPLFNAYYSYQTFGIDIDGTVKGGMQDMLVGAEYRFFRNVAFGAAYNKFSLDMAFKKEASTLHVNASWYGLMLYGAAYF